MRYDSAPGSSNTLNRNHAFPTEDIVEVDFLPDRGVDHARSITPSASMGTCVGAGENARIEAFNVDAVVRR